MLLHPRTRFHNEYALLSARCPAAAHAHYFPGSSAATPPEEPNDTLAYWWPLRTEFAHEAVAPHDHDFYEVVLVCAGRALHVTESGEHAVEPGSVLVIPPRACHSYDEPRGLFILNVYYIAEWLADDLRALWQEPGLVHLFLAWALFRQSTQLAIHRFRLAPGELGKCLYEMREVREAREAPAPSALLIKAALLKALVLMSAAYMRGSPEPGHESFRPEVWLALDEVETCIGSGIAFSVAKIAERGGIAPAHLVRLFKAATGHSVMAYYQRRRVQYGTRMLLRPDLPITEVAHRLGYCDSSHFARMFARYHGVSPSAFRDMMLTH